MTRENSNPPNPESSQEPSPRDQAAEGEEVDKFFERLPGNFHWPKPNAEAVAAAVEAIHRISGSAAAEDLASAGNRDDPANACSACGGALPAGARFCVWCGIPTHAVAGDSRAHYGPGAGQHHIHHHYHHHLLPGSEGPGMPSGALAAESEPSAPRGRAPVPGAAGIGSLGRTGGGRAETSARQVVQDWAQACNSRHIDDLLELYSADATLIRSSVPPVRSLPAIREFLVSLLEAGLGDVEMESLRLEVMGEIALDLGRCKMLVPVALGKRREERGKYLVVLVRQPAGTWKILADCWSSDPAVGAPPAETAARKGSEPIPPQRKSR